MNGPPRFDLAKPTQTVSTPFAASREQTRWIGEGRSGRSRLEAGTGVGIGPGIFDTSRRQLGRPRRPGRTEATSRGMRTDTREHRASFATDQLRRTSRYCRPSPFLAMRSERQTHPHRSERVRREQNIPARGIRGLVPSRRRIGTCLFRGSATDERSRPPTSDRSS